MMVAASNISVFLRIILCFLIRQIILYAHATDLRGQYWSPSPKAHGDRACWGSFIQNGLPHQWHGLCICLLTSASQSTEPNCVPYDIDGLAQQVIGLLQCWHELMR